MNGDHPLNMPTRRFPRAACVGPGTVAPEGVETVRIDFRAAPFTELFDLITQRVNELNGPEGGSG